MDKHASILVYITGTLTRLATGKLEGRWASGGPCGSGKTLSAQAWIAAVHELDRPYSCVVVASEVNALIEFRRRLLEFGVPAEKIGILHSFGSNKSVPATPDVELEDKPYLLVTHALVGMGDKHMKRFNRYQGAPRSVACWDETMLTSDGFSLADANLYAARSSVEWCVKFGSGLDDRLMEVLQYLEATEELLENGGATRLVNGGEKWDHRGGVKRDQARYWSCPRSPREGPARAAACPSHG